MTERGSHEVRPADAHEAGWLPSRQRWWWGITFVVVGVTWLLLALDVAVAWDLALPSAVVAGGLLILVVGRRARGDGLVGLGVLLSALALFVAFGPGALSLSAGDRDLRVVEVAELDEPPTLGAGRLTVDLRELRLPDGVTHLPARVMFGELVVVLPPDVAVRGEATVAAGEIVGFDRASGGVGRSRTFDEPGEDGAAVVELELGVGFGKVEVRR
jgi:hypothetical protein